MANNKPDPDYPNNIPGVYIAIIKTYSLSTPDGVKVCDVEASYESFVLNDETEERFLLENSQNFCREGQIGEVKIHEISINGEIISCADLLIDEQVKNDRFQFEGVDFINVLAPQVGEFYLLASESFKSFATNIDTGEFSYMVPNGTYGIYMGNHTYWIKLTPASTTGPIYRSFLMRPYVPVSSLGELDCTNMDMPYGNEYLWRSTPASEEEGMIPFWVEEPNYEPDGAIRGPVKGVLIDKLLENPYTYYKVMLENANVPVWIRSDSASCMP